MKNRKTWLEHLGKLFELTLELQEEAETRSNYEALYWINKILDIIDQMEDSALSDNKKAREKLEKLGDLAFKTGSYSEKELKMLNFLIYGSNKN
jgi:hypothetical protein